MRNGYIRYHHKKIFPYQELVLAFTKEQIEKHDINTQISYMFFIY